MTQKIRTTHVGSLPRTPELLEAYARTTIGEMDAEEFNEILQASVDVVVRRQLDLGLDIINDGEYGHLSSGAVDFGAWWSYIFPRLGGLRAPQPGEWVEMDVVRSSPGDVRLTSMTDRRDWTAFREAYNDPESGCLLGEPLSVPTFTGPVSYIGQDAVAADVNGLTAALDRAGHDRRDAFVAAIATHGLAPGQVVEGDFTAASGRDATAALLGRAEPPTAIIYANDVMAIAGLSYARSRGLRVPEDLSVTGFDDSELSAHLSPGLTSMSTGADIRGAATARTLLAALAGEAEASVALDCTTVVQRDSIMPPATTTPTRPRGARR